MIVPSGAVRVLVATRPVDFRKGMDGLAALVRESLGGCDPYSGVRDDGAGARFQGAGASRKDSSGLMRATSGLGPATLRQALPTSMRPTASIRGRPSISQFGGILQVDGYGAYAQLAQHADVALAFCWSHVRRQFYEIQVKTPAPIATQALVRIAALYAIEADIRGLSADERRQARQRRTSLSP